MLNKNEVPGGWMWLHLRGMSNKHKARFGSEVGKNEYTNGHELAPWAQWREEKGHSNSDSLKGRSCLNRPQEGTECIVNIYSGLPKDTLNWALLSCNVPHIGCLYPRAYMRLKDIVYYYSFHCYWMQKTAHANPQLRPRTDKLFSCFLPRIQTYNYLWLSIRFAFQDIKHFK